MNGKELWRSVRAKAAGALLLCLGVGLLAFPGQVQEAVRTSLLACLTALVPSLFPFLALTGLVIHSGAGNALGGPLGWGCRVLFRLPECCAAPLLMGFVGGYPAGARGASLLLEQGKIDREQAGRMMLFCVNPGPAFVVTYVGGSVLGDLRLGWLLCLSGTLAGLALGVLSGIGRPVPPKAERQSLPPSAGAVTRSVADASRATLTLCAWVVLFAGGTALLRETGILGFLCRLLSAVSPLTPPEASAVLAFLLEVIGGTDAAAALRAAPALVAFGLGFGGLCVHLQLFSFFREFPARRWKFFLFRLLHGLLAAGIFTGIARGIPGAAETAAPLGPVAGTQALSGTWAGGLSLLLMCGAFLLIAAKDREGIAEREKM